MKILIVSFTMFISSLIMINIHPKPIDQNIDKPQDYRVVQDISYLNQKLTISNEEIISDRCDSCHGGIEEYYSNGSDFFEELNNNYDPSLTVHQENHASYISSLESFIDTHTEDEAAEKNVDLQKVIIFLEGF